LVILRSTAREGRALQEDLLVKAQQMFSYCGCRKQSVGRTHARTSLDQVLGETLETNHVSVDDALTGRK
jgi:hypothetical protein